MTPALTPLQQSAYDRLGQAITRHDRVNGWPVATLLAVMLTPVEHAAAPLLYGWTAILDPEQCPPYWLPWLAQAVGTHIPQGTPDEVARLIVKDPPSWYAGTPAALLLAVKRTMVGTRRVELTERVDGNPWRVHLTTYADETPDPAATLAAAKQAVEAGINVTLDTRIGWSWQDLADSGLTWHDVTGMTAEQLAHIVPGTTADQIKERYPAP